MVNNHIYENTLFLMVSDGLTIESFMEWLTMLVNDGLTIHG